MALVLVMAAALIYVQVEWGVLCLLAIAILMGMLARGGCQRFCGQRKNVRIGPLSQAHRGIAWPELVPSRVVSATEMRILEITARLT